jgi:hypothetical protein
MLLSATLVGARAGIGNVATAAAALLQSLSNSETVHIVITRNSTRVCEERPVAVHTDAQPLLRPVQPAGMDQSAD